MIWLHGYDKVEDNIALLTNAGWGQQTRFVLPQSEKIRFNDDGETYPVWFGLSDDDYDNL